MKKTSKAPAWVDDFFAAGFLAAGFQPKRKAAGQSELVATLTRLVDGQDKVIDRLAKLTAITQELVQAVGCLGEGVEVMLRAPERIPPHRASGETNLGLIYRARSSTWWWSTNPKTAVRTATTTRNSEWAAAARARCRIDRRDQNHRTLALRLRCPLQREQVQSQSDHAGARSRYTGEAPEAI